MPDAHKPGRPINDFVHLRQFLSTFANPKDRFDAVWDIVKECGEEERHFNQLQSVYRGIASTWLLATFAAVGYLMYERVSQGAEAITSSHSHATEAIITCLLGTVGIGLLAILDLDVYHRLLVSAFNEGEDLEVNFPWLPHFRRNMTAYTKEKVRFRLAMYYSLTAVAPVAVGSYLCWRTAPQFWLVILFFVLSAVCLAAVLWRTLRQDGTLRAPANISEVTSDAKPKQCPLGQVPARCEWLARVA